MGLADWFSTFCSNIIVRDGGTISMRYKAITKRLNTDFWTSSSETAHSLYVGSYGRNTAIQGFSDLDIIFNLPFPWYEQFDKYQGNGQSALLQVVRDSLKKTYSTSSIGANGQVVQICFNDGIAFEVVPAFSVPDGSYIYLDSNNGGSWKVTNPRPEITAIKDRNTACNNNLIPLCRMMRAWKKEWSVPMGGLLIDTLAYQFINNWANREKSYLYYDYMCRDFFDYMANQSTEQSYWLSPGSNQYVYKKGNFQSKARQCCNLAKEAITFETSEPKMEWSAKQKWREIFGTAFPS